MKSATRLAPGPEWKLCCCKDHVCAPPAATAPSEMSVDQLQLSFTVSRDEEHVHLLVRCGDREFDLGDRGHNYLLLTLARRRIADTAQRLPDATCGWLDLHDLRFDRAMSRSYVNVDVFRIRRRFAELGVVDADQIVERRRRARQLRIGSVRLSVAQT
ncbi:MAG: hypothetical protein ABSC94_01205 [Polyangiaceae bacterium]|jgi:hypothetical protein